ncbi:MAG: hypothetical protein ACON4U_14910 [Myxococcota bacterium]
MTISLPGLYGLEVVMAGLIHVPFLGEIKIMTRSLLAVEIIEVNGQYWQAQQVCAIESYDSSRLSETRIPSRFVSAIPPQRIPIVLNGTEISWDPKPVYLGFDGQYPLPVELTDPRAIDSDQDGVPGVTVFLDIPLLGTVELYMVQSSDIAMIGNLDSEGGRGQIKVQELAQETIGSSHIVFNRSNQLIPQPEQSTFWLKPLTGNDCQSVVQSFPPLALQWMR